MELFEGKVAHKILRKMTALSGIISSNFNKLTQNNEFIPIEEFDLSPELLKALEKKGYTRPTAIQLEAIPAAMEERDVLGSAPTGTGKTAAFLLPAIQHLLDYPRRKPGAPRILNF